MKKFMLFTTPIIFCCIFCCMVYTAFATQIWVKSDANLPKKTAKEEVVITEAMKTEILKLDEITVQKVKAIVQGSSSDAKRAIEELVNEKKIVTKETRYSELYPSAELGP